MKKLVFLGILLVSMVCCVSNETNTELEELKQQNDSLQNELTQKDETMRLFEESFSSIQHNLSLISDREKSIVLNAGDLKAGEDTRQEITKDIQAINNLLDENKNTIARLNQKLANSSSNITGLKQLIEQLNEDIETKETEVAYLKENLTAANFTIEILNEMLDSAEFRNEIQAGMIQMQSNQLNIAYYAIGTYKELEEAGVLEKKGDIVGIAGSKQLKDDFNKDYFAQIDLSRTKMIPLNAKKVELATNHPTETYSIEGDDVKILKILDPMRFWETSKYLVVLID